MSTSYNIHHRKSKQQYSDGSGSQEPILFNLKESKETTLKFSPMNWLFLSMIIGAIILLVIFFIRSDTTSSQIDSSSTSPQSSSIVQEATPIKDNLKQDLKKPDGNGVLENAHAPGRQHKTNTKDTPKTEPKDLDKSSRTNVSAQQEGIKEAQNGRIKRTITQEKMNRIAPLFIAHGAPTLAIEPHHTMNKFLSSKLAKQYKGQSAPKAVVVFTAHWEDSIANNGVGITFHDSNTVYDTIHDFYGFPDEMYTLKYPAKGAPKVAQRIEQLLNQNNIKTRREYSRGLDHGTWVVLKTLFPEANIPVVQCSVDSRSSIETHYNIGKALAPLANEEVLVIGSGSTVHNLGRLSWGKTSPDAWAVEFDDWLIDRITKWNTPELFAYEKFAPNARAAVPRSEHYVPVFVAMGMSHEEKTSKIIERFYDLGSLSYLSFSF